MRAERGVNHRGTPSDLETRKWDEHLETCNLKIAEHEAAELKLWQSPRVKSITFTPVITS